MNIARVVLEKVVEHLGPLVEVEWRSDHSIYFKGPLEFRSQLLEPATDGKPMKIIFIDETVQGDASVHENMLQITRTTDGVVHGIDLCTADIDYAIRKALA